MATTTFGSAAACLFGALLLCAKADGRLIHVPDDYAQIGMALVFALPNDTILVGPGVYEENIVWPATQGLKLLSTGGPEATILDGGGQDQVIGIYSAVDTSTTIRGFTVRNGHASGT